MSTMRFAKHWTTLWSRRFSGFTLASSSCSRALSEHVLACDCFVQRSQPDSQRWIAKKLLESVSFLTIRGMMAGPSLTSASKAGPVALADELFEVSCAYQKHRLDLSLLWLKLHLRCVPGCVPCVEKNLKVGDCRSVRIFQRGMQLMGSRHCFLGWWRYRLVCSHWCHGHPPEPRPRVSWSTSTGVMRGCSGMRSDRMRSRWNGVLRSDVRSWRSCMRRRCSGMERRSCKGSRWCWRRRRMQGSRRMETY